MANDMFPQMEYVEMLLIVSPCLTLDGQRPNLHLLVESKVARAVVDESNPTRAIGVEYQLHAKKLVVVSAGALGTPQVPECSRVGNAEFLKKLNVSGDGESYQEHHLVHYPYKSS